MKKLLALVLILAMASSASAVLTSYQGYYMKMVIDAPAVIGIGDTVGVEIFAGDSADVPEMLNTVLNVDAAASISAITISTTGDWSFLNENNGATVNGSGYDVFVDGTLPSAIAAGSSIYSFSFTTSGVGTVTIDAVSGSWATFAGAVGPEDGYYEYGAIYGLPYAEITVVPEPMTIALLGLGGLFLRRRRS